MKQSMKDKIKGSLHEVKGSIKETAGEATNNDLLTVKGQIEKIAGKAQQKVGQMEEVLEKKVSSKC